MAVPINEFVISRCNEIYPVGVNADGTFQFGPRGWAVTKEPGTGLYTITHNFGTTNYLPVVATMDEGNFLGTAGVKTRAANSILVITYEGATPRDIAFALLVFKL